MPAAAERWRAAESPPPEGEREQIAAAYTLSQKKLEHLQTVLADLEGKGAGAGIGT